MRDGRMSDSGFRLTREDFHSFRAAQYRVLLLLSDGEWHDRREVQQVAGTNGFPASEGTKRLRELRPRMLERGYVIPCRRVGPGRETEYRLMTQVEYETYRALDDDDTESIGL